jgi:SNF2 family DNA or RNA helicase
MGLGKTAVVLQSLTPDHFPALVIAPKRVAENVWQAERDIWQPDLSMAIAAGKPADRKAALDSGSDVVVIGRDNIKDVPVGRFRTIVLDELSSFKSHRSLRFKTARKLCRTAVYVWGLTGTPRPNTMMDLFSQVHLLDSGERLGKFITHYRNRYFNPGRQLHTGVVVEWKLKRGAKESIEKKLSDICLSMTSADHLGLPPVTYNKISVPLPAKVMAEYNKMRGTLVAQAEDKTIAAANAAVMTSKLSQITAGFLYDTEGGTTANLHDEKTKAVQEIIDGTGSPVLVFYRFVEERLALSAIEGVRTIDEPGVIQEWDEGKVPVLLAHPASAGHGLNLQAGGHTIVWASPTWSLEEHDQGNARLARQGQGHPVVVHYLVSPGTVDEDILDRLDEKSSAQQALMHALKGR